MSPLCASVRDSLPGVIDEPLAGEILAHTDECLRCQAEIAQYRRIGRHLRSLEPQLALVPLGLPAAILRALAEAQGRSAVLWKGALIGAGTLVAAAGTAAGILIQRHRRLAG